MTHPASSDSVRPDIPSTGELALDDRAALRRVAGLSRGLMGEQLRNRVAELGAAGVVLSGDPREGVVLGDQRAAHRPPGRGVLVRRDFPPSLIQVALDD